MARSSRRSFLAGLVAASAWPLPTWADLGSPAFLSAGRAPSGQDMVAGLDLQGNALFQQVLPGRGHAVCAHPRLPHIIAFARRPGRFAHVLDCRTGKTLAHLQPPDGYHFYGHGCFSTDGTRLFTTENDYENARGVIGVWSVQDSYQRIGSFSSGGIGPHDMAGLPGGSFVVANGGIETHPDTGRSKLNLATMQSNLSYLSEEGVLQDQITLSSDFRLNSIRHLDIAPDGTVAFAMQWQGDIGSDLPLAGLHKAGTPARLLAEDDVRWREMKGYGGSIAFDHGGTHLAITSPRGNRLLILDTASDSIQVEHLLPDVCGIAPQAQGWCATSGTGQILTIEAAQATLLKQTQFQWDNHLVAL
ncbi:DUF1513 domain-containing protein [Epibacterium ulvae]|uniref:DUF1513 domain-containing protein n=1 Tax=Epibacterium ulvae TaxID=1156985 RepID=UPI002490B886|nr:DUF1513 domain-containing protein [Epibacterium ulvae]